MSAQFDGDGLMPAGGETTRSPWRVWFIAGLICFLLVQGVVDGLARMSGTEAYPMIAGPGFGAGKVGTDGRTPVTVRKIQVIDADGALHDVAPDVLLAPMPTSTAGGTVDRLLKPSADGAPSLTAATVEYLKEQTERLDLNGVGLRLEWVPEIFEASSLERSPAGAPTVREVTW